MTDAPKLEAEQPKVSAFEMEANKFIQNAVAMLVNGVRSSMPSAPTANLMVKLCSAFGVGVGNVLSIGALGDIFPLRNACVDAFREGMKSVKIMPPPAGGHPIKLDS